MLARLGCRWPRSARLGVPQPATVSIDTIPEVRNLAQASTREVRRALESEGLWIDLGAVQLRVQGNSPILASQLQAVYRNHPFRTREPWADLHIRLDRPAGPRRWFRPQVIFSCDGQRPFEPFPADSPLPLLEWGGNWLIGQRLHHLLLLHAGVVEKDGRALVMPATPGSGKSTLTAALSLSGWRLLSDEFGAFDPVEHVFRAVLKPIALKNASIGVIRQRYPEACFGPEFPKTRKGTVAHLAASHATVMRRREPARTGAIVLPQWRAGCATRLEAVEARPIFGALAFNAFNYKLLGAIGFDAVVHLVRACPAYQLIYSDLDDAIATIDDLWSRTAGAGN